MISYKCFLYVTLSMSIAISGFQPKSPISLFPKLLKPKNLRRITSGLRAAENMRGGIINAHGLGTNLVTALNEAIGSKTHNRVWSFDYLDSKFLQISSGFSLQRSEINNLRKEMENFGDFFGQKMEEYARKTEKEMVTTSKNVQWNYLFSVGDAVMTGFVVSTLCVVVLILGLRSRTSHYRKQLHVIMSALTRYKENFEGQAALLRQRERINNQRETLVNSPPTIELFTPGSLNINSEAEEI